MNPQSLCISYRKKVDHVFNGYLLVQLEDKAWRLPKRRRRPPRTPRKVPRTSHGLKGGRWMCWRWCGGFCCWGSFCWTKHNKQIFLFMFPALGRKGIWGNPLPTQSRLKAPSRQVVFCLLDFGGMWVLESAYTKFFNHAGIMRVLGMQVYLDPELSKENYRSTYGKQSCTVCIPLTQQLFLESWKIRFDIHFSSTQESPQKNGCRFLFFRNPVQAVLIASSCWFMMEITQIDQLWDDDMWSNIYIYSLSPFS